MINTERQPASCATAATLYRRTFDWPCTALGHAVWTLAGEELDAVDAPAHLGPGMVAALRHNGQPQAVIEVPGEPARWRFPVAPSATVPHALVRQLTRHGATYLGHGALIELPPSRVRGGSLTWRHGPAAPLPALATVVAALVTVAR
ncbi:MAG TPA: hypothetical protein VGX25_15130 [Actinophytocola sp.]|uniref:hypothetical protein n=1 Tax=Actinophytocola sp. TaxID=1872138 RepID=UPI002DDD8B46|nr:hypothetical protein [Actinophytocola sp.]HEV2780721.1 hypothetical protein [Actinophytocola sp.]